MALQALALYSTLVFSPEGSSTVTVQSDSSQLTFDVNPGNKLLYQEETMQGVSGKYSLEVKGTACVSVQVSDSILLVPFSKYRSMMKKCVCTQKSTFAYPSMYLLKLSKFRMQWLPTKEMISNIPFPPMYFFSSCCCRCSSSWISLRPDDMYNMYNISRKV